MKYRLILVASILISLSSCIGDIRSLLEVPMAIQKEINAQSVHITEASFESLAAIHITLKDSDVINPKTDLFKVQSIAYRSAYKAYQIYSRQHIKSLHNYRVDIAYKDNFFRYYYYDSLQFTKRDIYWQKIESFLNSAKNKQYVQVSKLIADSVDTIRIIKLLKEFNFSDESHYQFFALESIESNNQWLTRYWIKCNSGTKFPTIAVILDPEKGSIKDIILKPSEVITVNQ